MKKRWKNVPGKGLTGDRIVDRRRRGRAYRILHEAILAGKIKLTNICVNCGSTENIRKHHDDYRFPLKIKEVCESCHCHHHRGVH